MVFCQTAMVIYRGVLGCIENRHAALKAYVFISTSSFTFKF